MSPFKCRKLSIIISFFFLNKFWLLLPLLLSLLLFFLIFFFKGVGLFIYLFLVVLGLHSCVRAFSSCSKWGPLFITVRRPLTIAASLVVEHRFQVCRLSNCGSWAQLLRSMWDLPKPGLEPVSPALAGRFSTTVPPGKPNNYFFKYMLSLFLPFIISKYPVRQILVFLSLSFMSLKCSFVI